MSQRGSKKEAGGVNEAKARVVRGKIRNETEFVAREYSAPLLRVNAPLFVKAPSRLAIALLFRVLHNHFPLPTSHATCAAPHTSGRVSRLSTVPCQPLSPL